MAQHLISRTEAESDLVACAAYLAESINSVDGHAEAMAAVVPLYLERGDVDIAAELANTIDDPFTRDRLLIQAAEKCADIDDDEYALQLADAVEDSGLRLEAFERVATRKAQKDQLESARKIAGRMEHPDFVLASIAVREVAAKDSDAAFATLKAIEFPAARVLALLEIASLHAAEGGFDHAAAALGLAVEAAQEIEHDEERIRAIVDIGNTFIEANRNDRAIEVFDKAKRFAEELDNIHRDALLASVALGFLHSGSLDLADRTLDLVNDKTQIATTLLGYAQQFWKKEERAEAIDALEEAYSILKSQHERETRSSRAKFALFRSIAAQFAGFEKGERAIEAAQTIEDESEQNSALTQVAGILTLRKEDELARHAVRAIADDANRVSALIVMSDAKEKNGERTEAIALLKEAAHLAESVPQLSSRSLSYSEIAQRFINYGEIEKANEISCTTLQTIAEIRDESRRVAALGGLSSLYKERPLGDVERELVAGLLRTQ